MNVGMVISIAVGIAVALSCGVAFAIMSDCNKGK